MIESIPIWINQNLDLFVPAIFIIAMICLGLLTYLTFGNSVKHACFANALLSLLYVVTIYIPFHQYLKQSIITLVMFVGLFVLYAIEFILRQYENS
jgi:hypothetical protein